MTPVPPVIADLLSDTLTQPSDAMRAAMASAEVGDDVFSEDPTTIALEREVADLLGHEAGLFTPSGSMANQLGIRVHVQAGEELITDSLAHVLRAEMGAAATLSGVTTRSWVAERGQFLAADALDMMATEGGPYQVRTALIVVENTHNFGGGTIQDLDQLREARRVSAAAGVATHMDGARLWHASVATGIALAEYAATADTVSVCLSKGLGAPVGSVLVGTQDTIAQARVWRKRFGGGMRQSGILAAAGRYALAHNIDRLAHDHAAAARMATACAQAAPAAIDPATVTTNVVIIDVSAAGWSAADFATAAAERGVRTYALSRSHVRMVWHLGVTDEATSHAIDVVTELLTASR